MREWRDCFARLEAAQLPVRVRRMEDTNWDGWWIQAASNNSRILALALWSWDFEVPTEQRRSLAIS